MKKMFCVLACCVLLCSGCGFPQMQQNPLNPQHSDSPAPSQSPTPTLMPPPQTPLDISSLDNKTYGWGLKKVKNAAPEVPSSIAATLKQFDAYYLGDTSSKVLYLTFDEGYENGYTSKILDVLRDNQVPACFFVTGPYLKTEQALIRRMAAEGHDVGNHTVNHPSMPSVSDDAQLKQEMTQLSETYYNLTGQTMLFMRPPKGEYSERTLALTRELGMKTIFWSFAYKDWDTSFQRGSDFAYKEVMDYIHNGSILLLHAVSKDNADALDRIIKDAKAQGYTFQSLRDLP